MSKRINPDSSGPDHFTAQEIRVFGLDALNIRLGMQPSPEQVHQLAVISETVCTDPATYRGRAAVNIDPTGYQSTCLPTREGRSLMVYWNPENNPDASGMPVPANIVVRGFRSFTENEKKARLSLRRPKVYEVQDSLYITADNEARLLRKMWGAGRAYGRVPMLMATKPATASDVELAIVAIVEAVRYTERTQEG